MFYIINLNKYPVLITPRRFLPHMSECISYGHPLYNLPAKITTNKHTYAHAHASHFALILSRSAQSHERSQFKLNFRF